MPAQFVSSRGEEYEIAGRAGPVELSAGLPIVAQAREDLLVIKTDGVFLCARPCGDIRSGTPSGEGLYAEDTRHLSELRLAFGDAEPVCLAHSVESGHRAVVHATNPALTDARGHEVPPATLNLRRTLLVADRLHCSVAVRNFHAAAVTVPLRLSLAADFADIFEVRGMRRRELRGQMMVPRTHAAGVAFGYEGEDGCFRETIVELDPPPAACDLESGRVSVEWGLELGAGREQEVTIRVLPQRDAAPLPLGLEQAAAVLDGDLRDWIDGCTRIETDNELFQQVLAASMRDLHALLTPAPGGRIPAAGIPWYVAPFGRDSLLTCLECLVLNPTLARDTLRVLAALQSHADDPLRDAEPGKIPHELRTGELARMGLIPFTPYYGTVDATPLFVLLAAAYWRWTADTRTLARLRPALDSALEWIDRYGDVDGDGFVEYAPRAPVGLVNHGWKDSRDSSVHADGTLAEGPIALVEVQGYVYMAKEWIAEVYEALGEPDRARALRVQAAALRAAFNEAFWNPTEGTFALALDGRKRQVASVTSNPGHCLYCGIVDDELAAPLAERLMASDMFSGWGVRTLSSESPAYNPMSYHNGSIWPHDNAILAAGLKRYGRSEAAETIAGALFDIAARARDFRLAELYCGFDRLGQPDVVAYPVACLPQAWAAGVPFMLLQTLLGISAHAPSRTLSIMMPTMPAWLGRADLSGLRVGEASVCLGFSQLGGITNFALLGQDGDVGVTLAAAARPG